VVGEMQQGDGGRGAGGAGEEEDQQEFAHVFKYEKGRTPCAPFRSMQYASDLLLDGVLHLFDRCFAAFVLGRLRILSAAARGNLPDQREITTLELARRELFRRNGGTFLTALLCGCGGRSGGRCCCGGRRRRTSRRTARATGRAAGRTSRRTSRTAGRAARAATTTAGRRFCAGACAAAMSLAQ